MKKKRMVSLSEFIDNTARERNINVSAALEEALRRKIKSSIIYAPEESLRIECFSCKNSFTYGFFCEDRGIIMCEECHKSCKLFEIDGHMHQRIPDFEGKIYKKIKKIDSN